MDARMRATGSRAIRDAATAYERIPGWLREPALRCFAWAAELAWPGDIFVQLGVLFGRSLCCQAELLRAQNAECRVLSESPGPDPQLGTQHSAFSTPAPAVRLIGVDTWLGSPELSRSDTFDMRARCEAYLTQAGLRDLVELRTGVSWDAARVFADGSVACLYVDASHTEYDVRRDLAAWLPKMRPGGLLIGDDYSPQFPGVIAAVDAMLPGRIVEGEVWWWRKSVQHGDAESTESRVGTTEFGILPVSVPLR